MSSLSEFPDGPHLARTVAIILACTVAGLLLRRIYFHPLSRFPGPKLAAATWWYKTYYEVFKDGAFVEHLAYLHAHYGPVVRVGPNQLHFNDVHAYNDIYANGNHFTKDPRTYHKLRQDESSFCIIDLQKIKTRRDILNPLFSRRAILRLEHVVRKKVDALITQLIKCGEAGKPANVRRAIRSTTLEVIYAYCFASNEDYIAAPDFSHKFVRDSEVNFPLFHLLVHFPWMYDVMVVVGTVAAWFNPTEGGVLGESYGRLKKKIDELIEHPELVEKEEHETVFHHLLAPQRSDKGPSEPLSRQVLWEEAINLIAAGSETVAGTLNLGTFHVLNNPEICARLTAELKQAWPEIDTVVRLESLEKLPYLTAVLKESLRLGHGVVNPMPRIVGPTDASIAGFTVPAGSAVAMGATFIHLNPDIFPDPHAFKPDRWLSPTKTGVEHHLVAFSKGSRNCLGMNLAWCEMYLIMGYMFRKLDMELYNTTVKDMEYRCHLTATFIGRMLHCNIRSRKE